MGWQRPPGPRQNPGPHPSATLMARPEFGPTCTGMIAAFAVTAKPNASAAPRIIVRIMNRSLSTQPPGTWYPKPDKNHGQAPHLLCAIDGRLGPFWSRFRKAADPSPWQLAGKNIHDHSIGARNFLFSRALLPSAEDRPYLYPIGWFGRPARRGGSRNEGALAMAGCGENGDGLIGRPGGRDFE